MSCKAPDLRQDLDLAIERQKKILDLLYEWYKQIVQVDPPPVADPSILSYNSKVSYYYTSDVRNLRKVLKLVEQGLTAAVGGLPGVTIDFDSIVNFVAETLVGTTKHETGEGYGTGVIKKFEGEIGGKKCIFRPMVVAVAFNFAASEYHTSAPVTAFGYWIYLFVTEPRSEDDHHHRHHHFKSIKGHTLTFELPTDIDIVGKRSETGGEGKGGQRLIPESHLHFRSHFNAFLVFEYEPHCVQYLFMNCEAVRLAPFINSAFEHVIEYKAQKNRAKPVELAETTFQRTGPYGLTPSMDFNESRAGDVDRLFINVIS
ncbi:hypothetical protein Clacol_000925 [Clathrus columnatus]|uniref:Uncharacterized protein n=1 Tax=Clathrus columnatus TaxID=1419009 RepID=A0AAV5A1W4_9AGAM|nr:hypothetical protein Clacol_000925 [Clathrus columnatus]